MELKLEGKVEGMTSTLKRKFIRVFRHSQSCASKAEGTIEAYLRTVGHMMEWVAACPGNSGYFQPYQLTKTVVGLYLATLADGGKGTAPAQRDWRCRSAFTARVGAPSTFRGSVLYPALPRLGYKGGKCRDIDLVNDPGKPLYEYLQITQDTERMYVFPSQRSERLSEEGIHHWFRTLKARATKDQ